jgi:hypothetical protein
MDEVSLKNFKALQQFMRDSRAAHDLLVQRVASVEGVMAMQQTEIQSLRQQVTVLTAMRGRGPTSGN